MRRSNGGDHFKEPGLQLVQVDIRALKSKQRLSLIQLNFEVLGSFDLQFGMFERAPLYFTTHIHRKFFSQKE